MKGQIALTSGRILRSVMLVHAVKKSGVLYKETHVGQSKRTQNMLVALTSVVLLVPIPAQ